MPFSEELKSRIKELSNSTCCWCQDIRQKVEIHHIIPQSQGGDDSFDNAAPLCSNCHTLFGNNPDLRKEIKQRKDYWIKTCLKKNGIDIDHKQIFVCIILRTKIYTVKVDNFNGCEWNVFLRSVLASAFLSQHEDMNRSDFDINGFTVIDVERGKIIDIPKKIDPISFPNEVALIYKDDSVNQMFRGGAGVVASIAKIVMRYSEDRSMPF